MSRFQTCRCRLLAAGAIAWSAAGIAQEYPSKPMTFIVPFAAGSATDQLARSIGVEVTAETKQQVVIDNKPGASGFIAAQQAAKAAPDGYVVLITTNTTHAANEHLFKKIPYDPVRDFTPVTLLGRGGQVMIVHPRVPAKTVAEFIALAKKSPGRLSFGSGSSSSRVAGELLQQLANIQLLHVPYKSNPLAITDLLGGQIDMMITDTATGLPQIAGGKVRALGVSTKKRIPLAPEIPTIEEAGVKGYEMSFWFAAYLPANAPRPIVSRLHDLLVKATRGPRAEAFYKSSGVDAVTSTPEELAKFQALESAKWGAVIKKAGIELE